MYRVPAIIAHHLSYSFTTAKSPIDDAFLTFTQTRYGIVGDNGVGKTTLLKLLAHQLKPEQGFIEIFGSVDYFPQINTDYLGKEIVADLLGISDKLNALERIAQGSVYETDYDLIGNDWDIKEKVHLILTDLDLNSITLTTPLTSLSGGQKTKCWLAKAMLSQADFLLFDEPTNNLDWQTKEYFYNWLEQTNRGILIASHDRQLLKQVDEIIELTSLGINHFGGNYTFYREQKLVKQEALNHQLTAAKITLKNTQNSIQQTLEKHERRQKKGRALRKAKKIDKLAANSKQGRSEKTQSKDKIKAFNQIQKAKEKIQDIKLNIEIKEKISANFSTAKIPTSKIILNIEQLSFSFNKNQPLFNNFNLTLLGQERLAIQGKNGSGKSTLIQLILGNLKPHQGSIYRGFSHACYLDQTLSYLNSSLTLVENLCLKNAFFSIEEAYTRLAAFNFRNRFAEKKASELSGGEYMRAGLAISLSAAKQPELLILDEPTNHLDIQSIESIEEMLSIYQGTLILVSHDSHFLSNIGITKDVNLS
ncbi:ABC-F family ATP-binding cassette domain-containing protein [Legionella sp. D16C41]|uniref:ABC-F family ATP-binding cassette domain-containing protein n=1 Tax=Legionella sp. D16C41 TaxID=3402688 RepID=UPI003AF8F114